MRSIVLIALFFGVLAAPAAAQCSGSGPTFFVTDRAAGGNDVLFTGERGLSPERRPIITYGVMGSPVSRSGEQVCSGRAAFMAALRARVSATGINTVFIYIHGYYTTFESGVKDAQTVSKALGIKGPVIAYSWPSKVTSRLTYVNDESNEEWSLPHFTDLIAEIQDAIPGVRISFAAHSLGSRFATAGIRFLRHSGCSSCLARSVFFAADVDSDTLYDELSASNVCSGTPNPAEMRSAPILLYVSNRDKALRDSQQLHGHQRAGQAGSEIILCNGVDTVDVGYYKTVDAGTGHSYQVDPRVLADAAAAWKGIPPSAPSRKLRKATRNGAVYYELLQ
jgi:esterase/lipase superfamily enzyme